MKRPSIGDVVIHIPSAVGPCSFVLDGLPSECSVAVFEYDNRWVVKVNIEVPDVCDVGRGMSQFATEHYFANKPSWREIADTIIERLAHEVEEHLGLDPHKMLP